MGGATITSVIHSPLAFLQFLAAKWGGPTECTWWEPDVAVGQKQL